MEKILKNLVSNHLKKKEDNVNEKKENELTMTDRLSIISKNDYQEEDFEKLMKIYYNRNPECDFNQNIFLDLELFVDNNFKKDNCVYNKIDYTKTSFGSIVKKKILSYPIYNKSILEERQNILKTLNKNKDLKSFIQNLENINSIQNDLIWFWKYCNTSHMDVLCNYVYFDITNFAGVNHKLNNNEVLLNIVNYYNIFLAPLMTMMSPLMTIIGPIIMMYFLKRRIGIKLSLYSMIKMTFKSFFNIGLKIKKKSISFISIAVWIIFYLQNCNNSIKNAKNNNKIIQIMQSKMNSLMKLISNTRDINDKLNINLDCFYIDYDLDKSLHSFNHLLNMNFNNTLFNNKGKILKSFKIINVIKNELFHIMKYIGVVDFCISNVLLMNDKKYCFTNYSNNTKPLIISNQFSHPYLENSVPNDISLNGKNMIITGPNAGGKSTFIKSVILNVILGQTIGINNANSFTMTLFYNLETYLHIPDQNGISSLFETEMIKSKNYIDKINEYETNKFSLIIMDEIFSSTNYIEGASGAYGILKKLSTYDNNMTLITTHYNKLSKLEKTNKFVNYKFEIQRDDNNDIIYNYKIKKGVSNQNIALELLKKNNFDETIIKDALIFEKQLLKNLKSKKKSKKKSNEKSIKN